MQLTTFCYLKWSSCGGVHFGDHPKGKTGRKGEENSPIALNYTEYLTPSNSITL